MEWNKKYNTGDLVVLNTTCYSPHNDQIVWNASTNKTKKLREVVGRIIGYRSDFEYAIQVTPEMKVKSWSVGSYCELSHIVDRTINAWWVKEEYIVRRAEKIRCRVCQTIV